MKRKKSPPPAPVRVRLISPWLVRVILLGVFGIVAAIYALVRHYTEPRAPMWVTIPPTYSSPTEIPAPDLIDDND